MSDIKISAVATRTIVHEGVIYNVGDSLEVPVSRANSLVGIKLTEDPFKAEIFSPVINALEKAKAGEQPNTNPIKPELINEYAGLYGIVTEGRNKSDVFADIVKEVTKADVKPDNKADGEGVGKNDGAGKSAS